MRSTLVRVVALGVLLVVAVVVLSQTARFFGGEGSEGGLSSALEKTLDQTTTGGSSFDPPAVETPVKLPAGVATVFFRPLVWEADNASTAFAALESLALLVMVVAGWRRLAGGGRREAPKAQLGFLARPSLRGIGGLPDIRDIGGLWILGDRGRGV